MNTLDLNLIIKKKLYKFLEVFWLEINSYSISCKIKSSSVKSVILFKKIYTNKQKQFLLGNFYSIYKGNLAS